MCTLTYTHTRGVIESTMGAYPRGTGSNPVEENGRFFHSCRQLYLSSFLWHTHTHTHTQTRTNTHTHTHTKQTHKHMYRHARGHGRTHMRGKETQYFKDTWTFGSDTTKNHFFLQQTTKCSQNLIHHNCSPPPPSTTQQHICFSSRYLQKCHHFCTTSICKHTPGHFSSRC